MSAIEIIVVVCCILFVAFVIIKNIVDKKNGKGCCGDCSSCVGICTNLKIKERNMKFLKCEGCGAIVKEIVPCNCPNCGIKCCGKQMVEIPDPHIKGTGEILTCPNCGAKVEVIVPCKCANCGIQCCGKQMV